MRPLGRELALIDKACPRTKAKKLSVYRSREVCLGALSEIVEAVGTDLQIVEYRPCNWDSEYVLFLDSLRIVENQLLFEYEEGDEETILVELEGDDEPQESRVTRTKTNKKKKKKSSETRNAKKESTFGASERPRSENERVAKGLSNPRISLDIGMGKGDVRTGRKRKSSVFNETLEAKSSVSCQRKNRPSRQQTVEVKLKHGKDRSDTYVYMDDYMFFLKHMMDSESSSIGIPQNVQRGKCKEKPESSSESDIIAVSDHPFSDGDDNLFVAAKNFDVFDVDEEYGGSGKICNSRFRKELMESLRKPYSESELFRLSCNASIRAPKIRVRELRDGRQISYKVDDLGKSYLQHAPDFKCMFMRRFGSTKFKSLLRLSLKDRHRALNLLRGLFFYYENVVHEDAFKPWMDAECLKTMPWMSEDAPLSLALTHHRPARNAIKARKHA